MMRTLTSHARLVLAAILTLALGLGIGDGAVVASNGFQTGAVRGSDIQVSGCVIRFSNADGTPSLHANAAHRCAGVKSVSIDQHGQIHLEQTVRGATTNVVLFAQCQTDETLGGSRGILCGASGGTDSTRFRLYDTRINRQLDLTKQADRDRVQHRNANLWVGWFHTTWDR